MSTENDRQLESMINNLPQKTGKSLEEWFSALDQEKMEKHSQMVKYIKEGFGVSHGFANTIVLLYRQNRSGGPETYEELVTNQYTKKQELKPIYEKLVAVAKEFGDDIKLAPKKSYVSLRRTKQFAILQPSTKTRMDVGLNLKNITASGPLIEGDKWSGMCSHRMEIYSVDDVTEVVINWLREAYQQA